MTKQIAIVGMFLGLFAGSADAQTLPAKSLKSSLAAAALRPPLPPAAATGQAAALKAKRFKHPVRYGALIGGLGGAAAGYVGMKSATENCPPGRSCSTAGIAVMMGAMVGSGLGAIAGWLANK